MQLIYYTGQDVALSSVPTDNTGAPVGGPVTVSLTVTGPSGQSSTPTVSGPVSGAYSAVVPSVASAGVWLYRWTAVGTGVSWVSEGQFTVRPPGVEQFVDLASVKAHLGLPPADTRQDDELQGFILAAADIARDTCGPFMPETHTQYFSGGRPTIVPDWLPIASVLSITEFYGLSGFALTEEPLGAQADAFGYTVDYATGQITRRTFGGDAALFAAGTKNIKVVYTAGRNGQIPYTVRLGALELIRHLWQLTQQGGRPRFGSSGFDASDPVIPTGFAVPARVLELWSPFRRPPGVA